MKAPHPVTQPWPAGLLMSFAMLWLEIEMKLPDEVARELHVQLAVGNVHGALALVADSREMILSNSDKADEYRLPGMLEGTAGPAIQTLELYALTLYKFLTVVRQWYQSHGSRLELSGRKRARSRFLVYRGGKD